MPILEITQAGKDSLNLHTNPNMPSGNFSYMQFYLINPTTFNKAQFLSYTTWAQQSAYLAANVLNGYASAPNFPLQGNSLPLIRANSASTDVANQKADRVRKIDADNVEYLYNVPETFGTFSFNMMVVYNSISELPENMASSKTMPIAYICIFDGIQFKQQGIEIEIESILQYTGISSKIEFKTNPIVSASLLEVDKVDLLPLANQAESNVYLISHTDTDAGGLNPRYQPIIAKFAEDDGVRLWSFEGYRSDTVTSEAIDNTTRRLYIKNYNSTNKLFDGISPASIILQFASTDAAAPSMSTCRQITAYGDDWLEWDTPIGAPVLTEAMVIIHSKRDRAGYRKDLSKQLAPALRKVSDGLNPTYDEIYDGFGGTHLKSWPNESLLDINDVTNGVYTVDSTKLDLPFGSASAIVRFHRDGLAFANYTLYFVLEWRGLVAHATATINSSTQIAFAPTWSFETQRINNVAQINSLANTTYGTADFNANLSYITQRTSSTQAPLVTEGDAGTVAPDGSPIELNLFLGRTRSLTVTNLSECRVYNIPKYPYIVATGTVAAKNIDGSIVLTPASDSAPLTSWGKPNAMLRKDSRYLIQFVQLGDGPITNEWHGLVRGFSHASIIEDSPITIAMGVPLPVFPQDTPVAYIIHEGIGAVSTIEDDMVIPPTPSDTDQWQYMDANGLVHKGGVTLSTTSNEKEVIFRQPFSTRCLIVHLTPVDAAGNLDDDTRISQYPTASGFYIKQNYRAIPIMWEAIGY